MPSEIMRLAKPVTSPIISEINSLSCIYDKGDKLPLHNSVRLTFFQKRQEIFNASISSMNQNIVFSKPDI